MAEDSYVSCFEESFRRVISSEGNYTDDSSDPGNWTGGKVGIGTLKGTKFGISAASYPSLDIKNLTPNQAREIYYKDYWQKLHLDEVEPALAYQIFDAAVQHGRVRAIKILQQALGITADGVFGIATSKSLKNCNQVLLTLQYIKQRLEYYTKIGNFNLYGRGWVTRMVANLDYAIKAM